MQRLLAKYVYKNYYELLKNDEVNLALAKLGWTKPAVIPKQTILFDNRLIRKHLNGTLHSLLTDFEFERILCRVGYTGPACPTSTTTSTTSSTTTTTTTSELILLVNVFNESGIGTINDVRLNGTSLSTWGATFPVTTGQDTNALIPTFVDATMEVDMVDLEPFASINILDSALVLQCQDITEPNDDTYIFINVDCTNPAQGVLVTFSENPC